MGPTPEIATMPARSKAHVPKSKPRTQRRDSKRAPQLALVEGKQPAPGRVRRRDSVVNGSLGYGSNDKINETRPDPYQLPLDYIELTALWRHGGYSRRFVESLPNDATGKGWTLKSEGEDLAPLDKEHKRLAVFSQVCEADWWARLYGGALIVMVTTDNLKGTEFAKRPRDWQSQPLDLSRVLELKNLVVLDRTEFSAVQWDTNPESPTFRRPLQYRVNTGIGGVWAGGGSSVHASRCIYLGGAILPPSQRILNDGCDDSILEPIWAQVRNQETLDHGLAIIAAELRIATITIRDLQDVETANEQSDYFEERMQLLARAKSALNMVLLREGETYKHEAGTVAGMAELAGAQRQSLQAVTGMPEQTLFGSAPGGLNTDGDSHRRLWGNVIAAYQATKYEPALRRLYDCMFAAQKGPWSGTAPADWSIEFLPFVEETAKEKADREKVQADTDAVHVGIGALDPEDVKRARYGDKGWQDEIRVEPEVVPGLNMAALNTALGEGAPTDGPAQVDVASQAMNGAQAAALQGMIESVAAKTMPLGALAPMIRASFPLIDQGIIDAIVASFAPPPPVAGLEQTDDDESEPQLSAAQALAAQLTEHQVVRCEHGSLNRCRLCGIERERALQLGENGAPVLDPEGNPTWALRWTAIGKGPEPAPGIIKVDSRSVRVYIREIAHRHTDRLRPGVVHRYDDAGGLVAIWAGIPLPEDAKPIWNATRLEAATIVGVTPAELDDRGHDPHVTLFFLGKVTPAEAKAATSRIRKALDELLSVEDGVVQHRGIDMRAIGLGAFRPTPSSEGDTPMFLSLESDALYALQRDLSQKLLTEEEQRDRSWFTPHATVGFYAGVLTSEQWERVYNWRGGRGDFVANTIELHVGGEVAGTWTLADR